MAYVEKTANGLVSPPLDPAASTMLNPLKRNSSYKRHKLLWPMLTLIALSTWLWWHLPRDILKPTPALTEKKTLVPLEAHIMSKCPDAKDCLNDMILPAMQNVSDKVDFTLSYIGT